QGIEKTEFIGYDKQNLVSEDMKILKDIDINGQRVLIFDKTPFYAESGGQNGDSGTLILDNGEKVDIVDVKKYEGIFLHFVG
ncbi:MAG: hypothetical protein CR971_02715, partial [candidate division SR1 bacterium]